MTTVPAWPAPPYIGDAWVYQTFPDAVPAGWVDCGPTAGGTLAKRQVQTRIPHPFPAWRWTCDIVQGDKVTTLEVIPYE